MMIFFDWWMGTRCEWLERRLLDHEWAIVQYTSKLLRSTHLGSRLSEVCLCRIPPSFGRIDLAEDEEIVGTWLCEGCRRLVHGCDEVCRSSVQQRFV